jgi:hypothetical protein
MCLTPIRGERCLLARGFVHPSIYDLAMVSGVLVSSLAQGFQPKTLRGNQWSLALIDAVA